MAPLTLLRAFWRGLCTNWIGTFGVVLTTSAFVLFLLAELLRLTGVVTNAYVGLLSYLALPALFVCGLLLIPLGWWRYRRARRAAGGDPLGERFPAELLAPRRGGARVIKIIAVLTLVNVLFLGVGGARMLHFMDQPVFCGTACHSVMGPEWATYQRSPHARVKCVECHVGSGAEAAVDAKLNGLWQMISVTFDLYERPIPTPVHNLRPARETCEHCHWPEMFYGDRIKRIVRHGDDRHSTPRYSTLSLKVGTGQGSRRGEIHWHVAGKNEVRYLAADPKRNTMRWVEVRQPDGSYHRYENRTLARDGGAAVAAGEQHGPEVRTLDCVDCHNRATHIYQDPEDVVDRLIATGQISRRLPFAHRRALAALTGSYRDEDALASIERDFRGSYRRDDPQALVSMSRELDRAVAALQQAYTRNVHPRMNVGWNPYPNHLGHRLGAGCRRCHSADLVDAKGRAVPHECTLCHSLLAYDSPRPFEFLQPGSSDRRQRAMGDYLRREFLGASAAAPASQPSPAAPASQPSPAAPPAAGWTQSQPADSSLRPDAPLPAP